MRTRHSIVPAKAGTHHHRHQLFKKRPPRQDKLRRGVWVPACAGTTRSTEGIPKSKMAGTSPAIAH
ncbi:hypothetical protein ACVWY5_007576 [Bradyrhizobium sp. USDA 3256]